MTAGVAAYLLLVGGADPPFGTFIALLVATYSLVRSARPLAVVIGLLALAGVVLGVGTAPPGPLELFQLVYPAVYFGGAATAGYLVRQRSARQHLLEAGLAADQRLASADERARIARELHDVVAHSVSLMVVHAEAADALLDTDPAAARASLHRIAETGRGSVAELRRMLDLLRSTGDGPQERVTPTPGLDQVDGLAEQARACGLRAVVTASGRQPMLDAGVQVTVYRVVQEALTNVVRHARATRVDVETRFSSSGTEVAVTDDGTGGHGLAGMVERAAVYGGTVEAGPAPDGGFRVLLRLPVTADAVAHR